MKFGKSIQVSGLNESLQQKAISFWTEHGIVFGEKHDNFMKGKRGSILGNLISFNMSKLITSLALSFKPTEILCELNVNTIFQTITEWNEAYCILELNTFESFLLHDDKREADWRELLEGTRKAAFIWCISGMLAGGKIPERLRNKIYNSGR